MRSQIVSASNDHDCIPVHRIIRHGQFFGIRWCVLHDNITNCSKVGTGWTLNLRTPHDDNADPDSFQSSTSEAAEYLPLQSCAGGSPGCINVYGLWCELARIGSRGMLMHLQCQSTTHYRKHYIKNNTFGLNPSQLILLWRYKSRGTFCKLRSFKTP